jgi:iron complex outermembrane receptor protein
MAGKERGELRMRGRGLGCIGTAAAAAAIASGSCAAQALATRPLVDLSLEELSNLRVTSVSRRPEPLAQAPASVYVITGEEIRRSAATSLPEALRLAPNLLVARVNAHDYAITSSRGFLSTAGNKLQVLIDGRSIYTPLFSGVLWDTHDVLLEDVERIEVISGPGGAIWGTNAVIGVINVVTKSAAETQGVLASGYVGNREDGVAARYGGPLGAGHFRVYAKRFERDGFARADGSPLRDGGWRNQGGFRSDWRGAADALTFQAEVYEAEREEPAGLRELSGAHLLGSWSRALADGASATVQAYFDRSERDQAGAFIERLDIFDVEGRYSQASGRRHHFTWGAGYRHAHDRTRSGPSLAFIPADRGLDWLNFFVQDEITLRPQVRLTVGARVERNSYTGWETMPSARIAWQPASGRLLWSALSRAVRSPSRLDRELFVPANPPFVVAGGPSFVSEVSNVFELGYRGQPSARASYSVTAFVHDHDDLRSVEPGPSGPVIENRIEGRTRGIETWGTLQATRTWRLSAGLVLLDQDLVNEPGSTSNVFAEGNDPSHQWMVRSSHDLGSRIELDLLVRRMGSLPSPAVPSYTALDASLGWKLTPWATLSLAGQNLLDPRHPEFGAAATRAEIPRNVFARLSLRY